jgi:hypothetical protein
VAEVVGFHTEDPEPSRWIGPAALAADVGHAHVDGLSPVVYLRATLAERGATMAR